MSGLTNPTPCGFHNHGAGQSGRGSFWFVVLACSGLSCARPAETEPAPNAPAVIETKGGAMVLVPAGSFRMGSPVGKEDEKPAHMVALDAFLMDRVEVTQAAYERLGLPSPAHFKGPNLPVEQVTWAQAAYFCNVRSRAEGLEPCYNEETGACNFAANGYRLPTEAEWEYACRAGANADYACGNDRRKLADYAWFTDNAGKKTHPVGQKKPNAWGLYDLHGNVAEWCNDVYDPHYYAASPRVNPRGPDDGKEYVLRGGAWNAGSEVLRSAYRTAENPGFSDACLARDAIGFRCVRNPPPSH